MTEKSPPGRNARSCASCRFWNVASQDQDLGRCHRHAPVPFWGPKSAPGTQGIFDVSVTWPRTTDTDHCGEWEARDSGS